MTLGEQIKAVRGDRKVKELAKELGISPQMLSRLENGKRRPSYQLMKVLVEKLGLDLAEAVDGVLPTAEPEGLDSPASVA